MLGIGNRKYRDVLIKLKKDGRYIPGFIRAHEYGTAKEGIVYEYDFDGKKCYCGVETGYPNYRDSATGLRVIGQHYGTNRSADLFGEYVSDDADTISVLLATAATTKTTRAVHGETKFDLKWVFIALGVIALLAVIYFGFIRPNSNKPAPNVKPVTEIIWDSSSLNG